MSKKTTAAKREKLTEPEARLYHAMMNELRTVDFKNFVSTTYVPAMFGTKEPHWTTAVELDDAYMDFVSKLAKNLHARARL